MRHSKRGESFLHTQVGSQGQEAARSQLSCVEVGCGERPEPGTGEGAPAMGAALPTSPEAREPLCHWRPLGTALEAMSVIKFRLWILPEGTPISPCRTKGLWDARTGVNQAHAPTVGDVGAKLYSSPPLTMCFTADTIWEKMSLLSGSESFPSVLIFPKSSPPPAYSITKWSLDRVSTTSYRRMMLGWCNFSMLEISRDSSLWVFWSNLVLSRILMATFSGGEKAKGYASVHRSTEA